MARTRRLQRQETRLFYILVEIARRFGVAFIEVRREDTSQGDEATVDG